MKSRSFSGTLKVYIRIMSILPSCLGILEISRPISCYKNSLVRCAHSFVLVAGYWTRYFPVSRDKRVILIHFPLLLCPKKIGPVSDFGDESTAVSTFHAYCSHVSSQYCWPVVSQQSNRHSKSI